MKDPETMSEGGVLVLLFNTEPLDLSYVLLNVTLLCGN